MTLLDECLMALGNDKMVLSTEDGEKIIDDIQQVFPFTQWGRIDWDNVNDKLLLNSDDDSVVDELAAHIDKNEEVYVFWDEESTPVILTAVSSVLRAFWDVTAVGFNTWLWSKEKHFIIECDHEGEIYIGYRCVKRESG